MQGDWSLPNWLCKGIPFFLLPSYSRLTSRESTTSFYFLQDVQVLNLVNALSHDSNLKPRFREFGGALKVALQSAIAVLQWKDLGDNCRRERTFGKEKLHRMNNHHPTHHAGLQRSIKMPLSLSYSLNLYFLLERLFMQANSVCFPVALALSTVVMPPLENLPSTLLPAQLDKAEDVTLEKEGLLEEKVEAVDISKMQTHKLSGQEKMVVEPKTGFSFPAVLDSNMLSNQTALEAGKQVLAGVGLRSVTIMKLKNIKIYAFGLYIRPDVAKAQLTEKYGTFSSDELKRDPRFYADLLSHELGMTVRLLVHYKALNMGMVKSAFDTSLRNRLQKIKGVGDDEGLEAFNSYFSQNLLLPRGTIIDFQWLPGGQFRTEIDGQHLGTIHSRDFCRAFFDIYIGDPPVSCKAKDEMGEKLSQILRAS